MINKKIKKILLKKNRSKIISLTAYSKNIAKILDNYCDIVLVGDSLALELWVLILIFPKTILFVL